MPQSYHVDKKKENEKKKKKKQSCSSLGNKARKIQTCVHINLILIYF